MATINPFQNAMQNYNPYRDEYIQQQMMRQLGMMGQQNAQSPLPKTPSHLNPKLLILKGNK